MLEYTKC